MRRAKKCRCCHRWSQPYPQTYRQQTTGPRPGDGDRRLAAPHEPPTVLPCMTRLTLVLPTDVAVWLRGYAAARGVSPSRCVRDLLVKPRATLAQAAKDHAVLQETLARFRSLRA